MESDVRVREVVDREYVGASESDGVLDTAALMLDEGVESVVVLRGSEPVGVLTERDVLRSLVDGDVEGASVGDVMTEGVETVRPDDTLVEAADVMSTQSTKRLVVAEGAEPVGVLTEHDMLNTSPFRTGHDRAVPPVSESAAETAGEPAERAPGERRDNGVNDPESGYEDQAICEACGSLSRDLRGFNGQLLCGDCRDI